MVERRTDRRGRVLKAGKIVFGGGALINCVVRNLSDKGACLEVVSPVGIPDDFELVFDNDHSRRGCKVAWRSEHRVGVQFTR